MPSILSRVAHQLAYAAGLSTRRAKRLGEMRILMLHGVGDRHFEAEDFERVLVYLEKHFELVSLAELVHRTVSRLRIHGREIAITFDDGLRNNATVAYPLLREMRVPATFFLCPELINDGAWLWNHEARARLEFLEKTVVARIRESLEFDAPLRGESEVDAIVAGMKTLGLPRRQEVEASIRKESRDFEPLPVHRRACDVLSWDEIKRLDRKLITIGSHTLTHPILPTLDDATKEREIRDSKLWLERVLGREVEFFCYPNGERDARARELVAETYRAAVTTVPGTIAVGADVLNLPRIGACNTRAEMAWRLARP